MSSDPMGGEGCRLFTGRFLAAAASCFFMTVVFFAHFTAIPSYSISVMGTDGTVAGFVAGVFILGDIAGRIIFGNRMWRYGPNRICVLSMVAGTGISVLYLLTTDVSLTCLIGFIHGFTYGTAELAVFARVTGDLPPEVRGKGIGYFTLSYSLAAAVGPFLSIHLVNTGEFGTVMWLGLIASAASAICAVGMGRDGIPKTVRTAASRPFPVMLKVLPISMVMVVFLTSYSGVLTFIAPYGIEIGMETYTSVFYIFLSAATIVSRVLIMSRFDTAGHDRILLPMFIIYATGMVMLGLAPTGYALLISAFAIGLALATVSAGSQVVAVEGLDLQDQGVALATVQIFIDLSFIIGPVLNGTVSGSVGYSECYMLMAGVGLISMLIYTLTCSDFARRAGRE